MSAELSGIISETIERLLNPLGEKIAVSCREENDAIIADIAVQEPGQFIGKGGSVLEAIQYMTQLIVRRKCRMKDVPPIVVDVGGYRWKREKELTIIAKNIAEKVARSGESVLLQPMNAWERKIVHMAVKEEKGTESESEDSEAGRRVRIKPGKKAP